MSIPGANVCSECWQGKHGNCDGTALNERTDEIGPCDCGLAKHWQCFSCGELLEEPACDDGVNHCEGCRAGCKHCLPGGES